MQSLSGFRSVFIVLDIVLFFAFLYALRHGLEYRPRLSVKLPRKEPLTISRAVSTEQWNIVLKKFLVGTPDTMKIAIIEADRFVDNILKAAGYPGEHMADRLEKLSASELSTLPRLWRAHRVRNEIVHSADYDLSAREARSVMQDYEAFLKEIKVLDPASVLRT